MPFIRLFPQTLLLLLLAISFAVPAHAEEWWQKQRRLEMEQSNREHAARLDKLKREQEDSLRQLREMERSGNASRDEKAKTLYFGDCPPSNPRCPGYRGNDGTGNSRPSTPDYIDRQPAHSNQGSPTAADLPDSGLFGAPSETYDPNPGSTVTHEPEWVGEGPCRRNLHDRITPAPGKVWRCAKYLQTELDRKCGSLKDFHYRNCERVVRNRINPSY